MMNLSACSYSAAAADDDDGYTWNHLLLASEAAAQLSDSESFATDGEDGWRGG